MEENIMKKRITLILLMALSVILMFSLTSCGTASGKSQSAICQDIQNEDSIYSDCGLKINSSTITKRQTNVDSKTDYVWIEVVASNDECTYYAGYELTYVLYNDGWILEDYYNDSYSYNAKNKVSQAEADEVVAANYESYEFVSREDSDNSSIFTYNVSKTEGYVSTQRVATVEYSFRPRRGWYYETSSSYTGATWNIEGEWYYDDGTNYIWVNVIDVDESSKTITVEYEMTYSKFGTWHNCSGDFASDGAVILAYNYYQEANYLLDDPYQIYTADLPETKDNLWIRNNTGVTWCGVALTKK